MHSFSSPSEIPARHRVSRELQERHGKKALQLGYYLNQSDPLADAALLALDRLPAGKGMKLVERALERGIGRVGQAPEALQALFHHAEQVPDWVNWEEIAIGGNAFLRSGMFGALILACRSLPLCYASPSGNKPLALSGTLVNQAPIRLAETGRFIVETCKPQGLRWGGEGYKISLRVRLKHAQVRRFLLASGHWKGSAWGLPINQCDLAATNLMFSVSTLDGLKDIGFRFSRREREGFLQLWRYSGYLVGVDPALLCSAEEEARAMAELILATQGEPDQDSRRLIQSLMDSGIYAAFLQHQKFGWLLPNAAARAIFYGLSRSLLGSELAESLGYPPSRWARLSVGTSRRLISTWEWGRSRIPGGTKAATQIGKKVLETLVASSLELR